jgi:predicted ArsR family transcriptional regulator
MATKKKHTAELAKLAGAMPGLIDALEGEIAKVVVEMDALKNAGLIYASEHWRKGADGKPKYFYLLYPQQHGAPRRRDYIGCSAAKIEEARAGIGRAEQYNRLAAKQEALEYRVRRIADALREAHRELVVK